MNRLRTYIAFLLMAVAFVNAHAQSRKNQAYINYINQYKDLAIEEMLKYRVPASITLAQGLLESRAGLSDLARYGNNHFGIKCHGWKGRKQYADDDARGECFRVYDSPKESFEDHSKFLRHQPRYARLFKLKHTDYKGWARGLKACGYATSPTYAKSLINIIELYDLDQFDRAKKYDKFLAERAGYETSATGRLHPIKLFNKNYYLIAREGDTFRSIGKEVGISYKKLAKYNERDKNDRLRQGDIIYLKKKQKKAPKQYKNYIHVVKAGESMYTIAQQYGIRLKNLYKINKLSPNYTIYPGAKLKVR